VPLSPLEPGSHGRASRRRASASRRRARRAGRRRLAGLLAIVAAIVVLVVVTTSSGTSSPRSPHAAGPKPSTPGAPAHAAKSKPKRPRAPSRPAAALPAAVTQAIDRVLAYTPFITGGVPHRHVVALTFDDGPSPYTASIVKILVRMHVPATFFVVGQQLDDFSSGLRDELAHGFAVGDHTENHAMMTQLSAGGQYRQIHDDAVRLTRLGAPFPRLYRPPYGAYNATTLKLLRQLKMLMTLWSVDTRDWTRPGTAAIIRGAESGVRPGAIILMHDGGGDRSETVAALPSIIKALRRRHYSFVTVPQLLRVDPPPRNQRLPHVAE
jgi:peptidoglycan/xylan/chitin deacetylase (PgdA/CDA1 family)